MNWKDYFSSPFSTDSCSIYIFDKDYNMMFDTLWDEDDNFVQNIVNLLNDEIDKDKHGYENVEIKDDEIIYIDEKSKFRCRGWGYLTSPNCCNLKSEEAVEIQKQMLNWFANKIKK